MTPRARARRGVARHVLGRRQRGRRRPGRRGAARGAASCVVEDAFVDVQQPDVASVLDRLGDAHAAVVVPLLLSAGYHVHVDLAREVAKATGRPPLGAALGPDDRLVDVLADRLAEAGPARRRPASCSPRPGRATCAPSTTAGSSAVGSRLGSVDPWRVGFLSAARPALADAIARTRATHPVSRVVVSSYLLAPGYFHDLAVAAGGDVTTAPVLRADAAPPASLVGLVLDRYAEALALSRAA